MLSKCNKVIIGEKYREKLDPGLEKLGLSPIYLPDNPNVDPRLSGHTDLSVLKTGNSLYLAPYLRGSCFAEKAAAAGYDIKYADISQTPVYPNDAQLNICIAGDYFIFNPQTAYVPIVEYLTITAGKRPMAVKQGYSRCSVCVLPDSSAITADRGVYAALSRAGIDCLLISEGYVSLDGFDYGFIGGASFTLDRNHIIFTGTLDKHPDEARITDFFSKHETDVIFLTDSPIFDIGSAIML